MREEHFSLKGSITVEASVLLPFVIVVMISFVFIIKLYYVQEILQHAISGACNEMGLYSLIYFETNAEELIEGISNFTASQPKSNAIGVESWISAFTEGVRKDVEASVRAQIALIPVVKLLVKENLEINNRNVDERLEIFNIKGGFNRIDFSGSRLLEDGKSIDIEVRYEINLPFLSQIFSGIKLKQCASACIWAGEDGINNKDESDKTCIWNMSNINRGREIRRLQGANLPYNFPTLSKFQNGVATSIKSLNIDKTYYKNPKNLELKLMSYIKKLDNFIYEKYGSITIEQKDISKKQLLLIIPETELLPAQKLVIDECIQTARRRGIYFNIIKAYGKSENGVQNDRVGEE